MKKRMLYVALLSLVVIIAAYRATATRQRPVDRDPSPPIVEEGATVNREYVLVFGEGSNKMFSTVITGANLDEALHKVIAVKSLDPATPDQLVNYVVVEVK